MPSKQRIFLDTSALLAGLNSPLGAAGTILAACFMREVIPVISEQIIEESKRNIKTKFPKMAGSWNSFIIIPPEVAAIPSLEEIKRAYDIIQTNDAPIYAAALKAMPDALVTWDTKHFLRRKVIEHAPFPILKPEEFLAHLDKLRFRD